MKNIFIHIGEGKILKTKDIIGIFDMDTATVSKVTRDFLSAAEKNSKLSSEISDIPRSFIICSDRVFMSELNTRALVRRSEKNRIF